VFQISAYLIKNIDKYNTRQYHNQVFFHGIYIDNMKYSLDIIMETICRIHPIKNQLFQLYHGVEQMIRPNSLQRLEALNAYSIV
jgi:hypothetical protein